MFIFYASGSATQVPQSSWKKVVVLSLLSFVGVIFLINVILINLSTHPQKEEILEIKEDTKLAIYV